MTISALTSFTALATIRALAALWPIALSCFYPSFSFNSLGAWRAGRAGVTALATFFTILASIAIPTAATTSAATASTFTAAFTIALASTFTGSG